ncbi:GGDEF domain-containing protein (plasmid) [Clostridium beijerinckii]|uniref:GGDEF domain-containing protein n=1 Tax=Clostridium beijerinckii TaxID=1520 RepID=UPI0022277EE4|nr:GGDEF domain-containing protein [Clostridium beijerinckii]UYZ39102.1 GGDEF domain-containing protein [Clostridium beijerinckii]
MVLISLFILVLILLLINVVLIVYVFKLRKKANSDHDNKILKEILDKVSTNELNFVDSSAIHIIDVLKKHYKIDCCTILIKSRDKLNLIASDIEDEVYYPELEAHCTQLLSRTKGKAIINKAENTFLDYSSAIKRAVKYSYFIPLAEIGALYIENYDNYVDNNFEVEFFNVVAKNIGIILQNCIYQDTISTLAMKDNLTGLYNRNYMFKHIKVLQNDNKSIVIAIMDIDHFKKCNDNYGHDFGDIVLKAASNYIKNNLDETDEIYRWGGEEFIISFVDQDIQIVLNKLNLIREGLSNYNISDGNTQIKITASFGVADFNESDGLDNCIKKADNGLYKSKTSGRNQVNLG